MQVTALLECFDLFQQKFITHFLLFFILVFLITDMNDGITITTTQLCGKVPTLTC